MRRQVKPHRFASFGSGSVIVPPAVNPSPHRVSIGRDVMIHDRAWLALYEADGAGQKFEPRLVIGDRTILGQDLYIACLGEVEIGSDVLGGNHILIADTYHDYRDPDTAIRYQPMATPRPVRIGDGVLLNPSVSILPGVTIGERSSIGAGAVVTSDVPPNSVVAGNPARVIRRFDRERGEWVDTA